MVLYICLEQGQSHSFQISWLFGLVLTLPLTWVEMLCNPTLWIALHAHSLQVWVEWVEEPAHSIQLEQHQARTFKSNFLVTWEQVACCMAWGCPAITSGGIWSIAVYLSKVKLLCCVRGKTETLQSHLLSPGRYIWVGSGQGRLWNKHCPNLFQEYEQ